MDQQSGKVEAAGTESEEVSGELPHCCGVNGVEKPLNVTEYANQKELSFVSQLNPTTGKIEWVEIPDNYDYHQEIARSAFADMLHDHDRNMRYFDALRYEVARLKSQGETVNVLDIGTGTGLLSMMAVVAGADNVFACDAFTPMLDCARKVVGRNGFQDKIKLIPKRSTELVVGVDIPYRCNLLVTEVFDTELIGEGAISTFNHAHKELLTSSPVVIPRTSTVYAQVVDCSDVAKWNSLPAKLCVSETVSVQFPENVSRCPGVPSCQDIQLDAIHPDEFTVLSPPLSMFKFDFTSSRTIPTHRESVVKFEVEAQGTANAVFLWWDLDMDTSGENVLTCQPSYVSKGPEKWFTRGLVNHFSGTVWRDHWMHSVYYIPSRVELDTDGVLYSAHDEYSFWFDVSRSSGGSSVQFPSSHPVCECGVHTLLSRYLIYMMNQRERYEAFSSVLAREIRVGESVCLCFSDCAVLPMILARMGAKKVFVVEGSPENGELSSKLVEYNSLGSVVSVITKAIEEITMEDFVGVKVDVVVADPHFHGATLPWNNLIFWYFKNALPAQIFSDDLRMVPRKAVLVGLACHFTHLWKINAPVGTAAGQFDLVDFDELIRDSSSMVDSPVDAQPLWEYETYSTSKTVTLMEFDLTGKPSTQSSSGEFSCCGLETNGIAIWVDWHLTRDDDGVVISTGPKLNVTPGDIVTWERCYKQGVYFLQPRQVRDSVTYHVAFNHEDAGLDFKFH